MSDPATISTTIITALVALMTGYMQYRTAVETNDQQGAKEPTKTQEIQKGEQVLKTVKEGITLHGNADEQADLANFERNPQRNRADIERAMSELATRAQPFAQQLQTLAQQSNIQTGGVQGSVTVSDSTIYGPVTGDNDGTITYTYNSSGDNEK